MPKTTIEIPCELGDLVFYVTERKDKKTNIIDRYIITCTVDCIHYGRKLKINSECPYRYIKLRSTNFYGILFPSLSFEEFEKSCFFTEEEARKEIERRSKENE